MIIRQALDTDFGELIPEPLSPVTPAQERHPVILSEAEGSHHRHPQILKPSYSTLP